MITKLDVTLVLPTHNEGQSIYDTLGEIDLSIPKNVELTVYVSEDGSSDNTRDEVLRAAGTVKNCTIQLSPPSGRLGYSRGVQRGIEQCRTTFIWFMDSDGQFFPEDIALLTPTVSPGAISVGFRNPRADGWKRIIFSKLFGFAFLAFGGPRLRDPSSPFILARTNVVSGFSTVPFHLSFGFWWEFQYRVAKAGLSVQEIGVRHRNRAAGETQVYTAKRLPKIILTHLVGLVKLKRELS